MGCSHWINTLLENLKISIDGNYHSSNFVKYAHRYLAEVQYRFNRRFDLASIFPILIFAGTRTGSCEETWYTIG